MLGAEEVERNVRLVADDPAVVWNGRDMKDHAGRELDDRAVLHRCRRGAGEDEPNVLDVAELFARERTDVDTPLPAGLVGGAPDRQPANLHQLEFSLLEDTGLIRILEALEDDVVHGVTPGAFSGGV